VRKVPGLRRFLTEGGVVGPMMLVSACLAGIPCRWDCKEKSSARVIELLNEGKAIPVCPEQLGGLTTPRDPSERIGKRVFSRNGENVTVRFENGAKIVLEIARKYNCKEAILKSKSPSCGSKEIYDGSFTGKLIAGDGVTAQLLKENGIRVYTEDEV